MTFFIAEIGINHGGSLDKAFRLIDSAVKTGCNAIKFQTYKAEDRVGKSSPLYETLKSCELTFGDFEKLKNHSDAQGVEFFSTAFDIESINFLNEINVKYHKIASFDIVNMPLIDAAASSGATTFMSTGMADNEEVLRAIEIFVRLDARVSVLHCVSSYPLKKLDANLGQIMALKELLKDIKIGYSDHTKDIEVPLYAVALGAEVIEKHFMLSGDKDCIDAPVSIDEKAFTMMIKEAESVVEMIGDKKIMGVKAEKGTRAFRRNVNAN